MMTFRRSMVTAALLSSAACVSSSGELHTIMPLQAPDGLLVRVAQNNGSADGGTEKLPGTTRRGVWLYRLVTLPGYSGKTKSLEVLFCPGPDPVDYSRCRVGVAWSAGQHPMGEFERGRRGWR